MNKLTLGLALCLILQNTAMAIFDFPHQGEQFELITNELELDSSSYANADQMSELAWNNIIRTQASKSCHLDIELIEHIYAEKRDDKIPPRIQTEEAYHVVAHDKENNLEFFDYKNGPYFYKKSGVFNFRISKLGGARKVIPSSFNLGGVEIPSLDYIIWQDNLFTSHITDEDTEMETKKIQEKFEFMSKNIITTFNQFFNDVKNTFSLSHMERSLLKVSVDMSTGSLLSIKTIKTKGATHYTHVARPQTKVETNCEVSLEDYRRNIRLTILQSHLQNKDLEKSKTAIEKALEQNVPAQSVVTTLTNNHFGIELLKNILPQKKELIVGFFDRYKLFHKDFVKNIIASAQAMDLSHIESLDTFLALDFNSYSDFLLDIMQTKDWPKSYVLKHYQQLDSQQKRLWLTDLIGKKHLEEGEARKLFNQYASPLYANKQEFSDAMTLMGDRDYMTHQEMVNKTYDYLGKNRPKDFTEFISKDYARTKIERELINKESSLGMAKLYFEIAYGENSIDTQTISDFYQVSKITSVQEYKLLKEHPELAEEMLLKALKDPTVTVPPMHTKSIYEKMTGEQKNRFLDNQLQKIIEDTPKRLSAYNNLMLKLDTVFQDDPSILTQLRSFFAEMIVSGKVNIDEKTSPIFSPSFLRNEFINEFTDTSHFKKAVELGDIKFISPKDPMLVAEKMMKAYPAKNISSHDYEIVKDYQKWLSYQQDDLSNEDSERVQAFSQSVSGLKTALINQADKYNLKTFDELLAYAKKWQDEYQSLEIQNAQDLIPFHNAIAKLLWDKNNRGPFVEQYLTHFEILNMLFIENALGGQLSNMHETEVYELLSPLAKNYPQYQDDQFLETYISHYLKSGVPIGREQEFIDLLKDNETKMHYIMKDLPLDQIDENIKNYTPKYEF